MRKVKKIMLEAVLKDSNTKRDILSNIADDIALEHVNGIQKIFKEFQGNIDYMKGNLGKAGYEVEFDRPALEAFDEIHLHHPLYGQRLNSLDKIKELNKQIIICKISKKNCNEILVQTKAETAEGDFDVELLGKYLALARATRIILGDYNV